MRAPHPKHGQAQLGTHLHTRRRTRTRQHTPHDTTPSCVAHVPRSVDASWRRLTSALAGLYCASLNQMSAGAFAPVAPRGLHSPGFGDARAEVSVRCSKGTYVRAIARDVGRAVGVPAHLQALRRTISGHVDDAIARDDLTE